MTISASPDTATLTACHERLRVVFAPDQPVFITEEVYDPVGPLWRVTLVYRDPYGAWRRRRYRYDIPSDTLYFAGEEPVQPDDVRAARRSGRPLATPAGNGRGSK
ncbi:MAG: hypothetical protein RMK84_11260 [Oscillochloridaceae bacterium]|nr:hypothetical protein [Chloroflexaceae bacterium]MDW8390692.1 hypothetical protein [Oscillochloridaceae bacterium]